MLRSHLVISTRADVPKFSFLCSRICCRDVGPNEPNHKHSLEEHLWHVGSATSTVASFRVARLWLGWLPSQAKLPLHDGSVELDRCATVHEMSNQRSVNAKSCPTQTWIALGKTVPTHNFAASPFLHYMISIQDHFRPCLSPSCDSYFAAFAVEMWA